MLQYAAFSFIARKTCVRLFSVKSRYFQRYCNGKRCFVTLILTRFYLKQRFCLFWLGSAVFIIIFQSTTVSSLFIIKLHFWRSILPKECFGLLATILSCFQPYVTKKSVFSLLCLKYAACSFIAGKTCFGFFAVKLGCFQYYCTGKRLSAASYFDFYLILLKRTFFFLFGLGTLFQYHVSENRLFFFFIAKLRFWTFILHKTCVGNKIESFELYVTKSSALVSRWKTRCFKLHSTENMFWLASNEIGFLEVYIAKKAFLLFVCYNTLHSHKKHVLAC